MADGQASDAPRAGEGGEEETPRLRCDFCGEEVAEVRRVALDDGYDRLQKPHVIQYACEPCSAEKERARHSHATG